MSLSRIALAADIDSRITATRSYHNGIKCLIELPPQLIEKEPQPQCAFGIFNIPGVKEAEEAEKEARSGNYLLAAQMISTAIDYYDSAGNNIKPKKPNMMLLGEKLDNSWLAKRAYYYRKCKKDALAIADLIRVVFGGPPRNEFTRVVAGSRVREAFIVEIIVVKLIPEGSSLGRANEQRHRHQKSNGDGIS